MKSLTQEEKEMAIRECQEKIADFKELLERMPEDTFLGRLCIKGYINKEEKKLAELLAI